MNYECVSVRVAISRCSLMKVAFFLTSWGKKKKNEKSDKNSKQTKKIYVITFNFFL